MTLELHVLREIVNVKVKREAISHSHGVQEGIRGVVRTCYDVRGAAFLRAGPTGQGGLASERLSSEGKCQCSTCSDRTCGSDQSTWPTPTFCLK